MKIISDIEDSKLVEAAVYQQIYEVLVTKSASDELFDERLRGNIYEDNVGVARFVLWLFLRNI